MQNKDVLTVEDYQAVLDKIDDGIFIIDSDGIILSANKAVENNGGKKIEDLLGRNIDDLVKEGYCNEFVSKRVITTGKKETLVQKIEDGRELIVTGMPYYKDGKLEMVIACERDVTELAKTRESLLKIKSLNEKYENELEYLRGRNQSEKGVISASKKMEETLERAMKVAGLDTTVLIQGESGTGKEVIANLMYKKSSRKDSTYIKVNCGAIPENLLESEMFGYVGGAFTGAKKTGKMGYFGMANGGTIFLDEINEIPLNLQVKLLRVIQEREMMPVGSDEAIKLDIRIIAATNQNLKKLVAEGKFRKDLYYRIGVISINIPPLRERKEDIIMLAKYFVDGFNEKYNLHKKLSTKAQKKILNYEWPGNVRELENMMESLVVITESDTITERDIGIYIQNEGEYLQEEKFNITGTIEEMVNRYEAELLRRTYTEYKNTAEMADALHTTRSTINRKLAKYGIRD